MYFEVTLCPTCAHVSSACTCEASPDEARAILEELHRITSAPAPLEDCPFTLTPPKLKRAPKFTPDGWQESLF
jgi:hypothetical protein